MLNVSGCVGPVKRDGASRISLYFKGNQQPGWVGGNKLDSAESARLAYLSRRECLE
jgi:hypothetical protein